MSFYMSTEPTPPQEPELHGDWESYPTAHDEPMPQASPPPLPPGNDSQVLARQPSVIIALFDEPDGSVGVEFMFSEVPVNVELPTSWVAEFLLSNWKLIMHAVAKGRNDTKGELLRNAEVIKPSPEFKLFNPNGGFLQ